MIASCREEFPVTTMCRAAGVRRSSFYAWLNRPVSARAKRRALVGEAVEETYHGFKKRYGAPRLYVELNESGIKCSLNHVAELLREKGLRARNGKAFRYCAHYESKTNVSENLLARRFKADAPNRKWVSDITYIKVGRLWLYLAVVLDLFSRKVVGWALDDHMREELILEALNMAVSARDTVEGMLVHSDRGIQYRGNDYQQALRDSKLLCSMSRKGNCWDNAVMEAFFSRLKVELIYAENYQSVEQARAGIFEYIEVFYNRKRRHSSLGYISPEQFERQFNESDVSMIRG